MARVEIYTKVGCPYCARAKALLGSKNVAFEEYDAAGDAALKKQMMERSGGRATFPQLFVDDKHIGGCDDLVALDRRGGLDPLLAH